MTQQQLGFFEVQRTAPAISGLTYSPEFLNRRECAVLLGLVDQRPWLADLKRRVQHYGYRYDYKARRVTTNLYLGSLPPFIADIADRLATEGLFSNRPDQAIVNEYLPGQGISPHIDCIPCFGECIATLSLGSSCEMEFQEQSTNRTHCLTLEIGSLLLLAGSARYEWTHAIRPRLSDNGVVRRRRVSLTFRTVVLG